MPLAPVVGGVASPAAPGAPARGESPPPALYQSASIMVVCWACSQHSGAGQSKDKEGAWAIGLGFY